MRHSPLCGLVIALGWLLTPGCSDSDAPVPEASCGAQMGKQYAEADCKAAGNAAGCASSTFIPGARTSCSFTDCREPPTCGAGTAQPGDAGSEASVDPKCAQTTNGLFGSTPPCSDVSAVQINGATQYACKCGQPCPCGFVCGSIALATGGTLSNVCAPE